MKRRSLFVLGLLMLLGGTAVCLLMAGNHVSLPHEAGIAAYLSMLAGTVAMSAAVSHREPES